MSLGREASRSREAEVTITVVLPEHKELFVFTSDETKEALRTPGKCDVCGREGLVSSYHVQQVMDNSHFRYECTGCQNKAGQLRLDEGDASLYRTALAAWNEGRVLSLNAFVLDEARTFGAESTEIQLMMSATTAVVDLDIPDSDEEFWAECKMIAIGILAKLTDHAKEIGKDLRFIFHPTAIRGLIKAVPNEYLSHAIIDTVMLYEETASLEHGEFLKWFEGTVTVEHEELKEKNDE